MARFLFWSDLHLEFGEFAIPRPQDLRGPVDAVLIAGDTDGGGRHVDFMARVWETFNVPVLAVGGNHEPWGTTFQNHVRAETEEIARLRSDGADVQVLRRSEREIAGTRVIGATLWTDLRLYPEMAEFSHIGVSKTCKDYRMTGWEEGGRQRRMSPSDTVSMHESDIGYIMSRLDAEFSGDTVVMTHHVPISQMMSARRPRSVEDCAFASDLWHRIGTRKVRAWLSGHSHDCRNVVMEGVFGKTCFLSNCRGYPWERGSFDPLRVVDTSDDEI